MFPCGLQQFSAPVLVMTSFDRIFDEFVRHRRPWSSRKKTKGTKHYRAYSRSEAPNILKSIKIKSETTNIDCRKSIHVDVKRSYHAFCSSSTEREKSNHWKAEEANYWTDAFETI